MRTDSKARKAITAALCALLATSPLLGCAGQAKKAQDASSSSMVKDAGEDIESQGKKVPYSKAGTYTVTLKEADFQNATKGDGENEGTETTDEKKNDETKADAEAVEKAKTALEQAKASRDEAQKALDEAKAAEDKAKANGEQAATQAQADGEQAIEVADDSAAQEKSDTLAKATEAREQAEQQLAKAEEAVKSAEEEAAKLEGQADAAKPEEKKDLTFADVKAENVKVYYNRTVDEANAQTETREAQVNALSNDGGALTLSFTDPDAAANATDNYVVSIESLGIVAFVEIDVTTPTLTVESGDVKSDSQSCDVKIKVADDKFASGISAGDLTLGGSFREMTVTGVEAEGDTLTAHLSGSPVRDYDTESTWVDGKVTVAASGFENSPAAATAYVPVDLPDAAFDMEGVEVLAPASVLSDADYVEFDGDTAKATLNLYADLGTFNDVKPENITLEGSFASGKVESVSKEGEDNDQLKVTVSFPKGTQSEDGYLYAGTLKLAAGTMKDERGQEAKEVSTTLILSPESMDKAGDDAEDAAKKAAEAKKKAQEAKAKKLSGIGEGFKYAAGYVGKVDPLLGQLTNYGASAFGMASSYVKGDWLDVVKGGVGMLQMLGVIPAGEKEVTAKDVLNEVKSLRTVVKEVNLKTDEISKENRENRYSQTLMQLRQIQSRCADAAVMLQRAAEILANRKDNPMKAPSATASKDELVRYNNALQTVIQQEEKKVKDVAPDKDSLFLNANDNMTKLKDDLNNLCAWISIDKKDINASANPIDILDKLVSMKFNWETQGYYARAAFRTELDTTIKSAWAAVSTYFVTTNTDSKIEEKYKGITSSVKAALQQIAARPAGQSPEEVRKLNQAGKEIKVYSPSLGFTIKQSRHVGGYAFQNPATLVNKKCDLTRTEEITTDDQIAKYRDRLSEGDIWKDLKLAGLDTVDPYKDEQYKAMFSRVGIAFRQTLKKTDIRCNVMTGALYGCKYESLLRGLRPDKSIVSYNAMDYDTEKGSVQIYAHFYWFDRA